MSKKLTAAYIIAFVLFFIAPTIIYNLFGVYLDQINYEQRNTAEKPVFSLETIGEYPKAYEEYFNDNLAFRTQMIEANSLIDFYLFRQSPVNKVIIGKDGWLFYNPNGKDGDPIADYRGSNLFSQEQLLQMANNLLEARDSLRAQGKDFVVYIGPNKESVYGDDYFPSDYALDASYTRADQVVEYLSENTDLVIVYPKEDLQQTIENNPDLTFYYKTDTHWNALGAYIGASKLLGEINADIPDFSDLEIIDKGDFPVTWQR